MNLTDSSGTEDAGSGKVAYMDLEVFYYYYLIVIDWLLVVSDLTRKNKQI